MSKLEVDKIDPQSGTNLELGTSGDTVTIPTGVTLDASNATTTLPANVVTTDGTQTLTNKTIDASQLSGTITPSDGTVTNAKVNASAAIEYSKLNLTGNIALADLSATGTKDATTFLRGDNTFAEAGGGKILQVIEGRKTDKQTNSGGYTNAIGAAATITPSSASNKIFVCFNAYVSSSGGGDHVKVKMIRTIGGTTVDSFVGTGSGTNSSAGRGYTASGRTETMSGSYVDSPATTSAITYQLQFDSDTNRTSIIGGTYDSTANAPTNVVVMEIAG